jgi:hypothetical protein
MPCCLAQWVPTSSNEDPPFLVLNIYHGPQHTNICAAGLRHLRNTKCYLLTYLLTPWSRVILEKLTGLQLVKKSSAFYGSRRFITAFTSDRHLSLSWASSIQFIPPHSTSWRSILILSYHLLLGLPSGLFPQVSPPKPCTRLSPNPSYIPRPSHSSRFYHPRNSGCTKYCELFMKLTIVH